MNCLPCFLAEKKIVPATHRYEITVVKASIPFCDAHLPAFRRFAGKIVALAIVTLALACGGSPFTTLEAAAIASGDDAGLSADQRTSAHPDDGGGSRWDGGGDSDPTTNLDAGSPPAPDARADGPPHEDSGEAATPDAGPRIDAAPDSQASPPDAAPDVAPDAPPSLCCIGHTQVFTNGACPTAYVVEPYTGTSGVGSSCTNSDCNGTVEVCP
jgi:hypothetical protein